MKTAGSTTPKFSQVKKDLKLKKDSEVSNTSTQVAIIHKRPAADAKSFTEADIPSLGGDIPEFDDPKSRRAAYGRLQTALEGNPKMKDALEQQVGTGKGTDLRKRQFLESWKIDPSFGLCSLLCQVTLDSKEEEVESTRALTWFKLVKEEGEEEAQKLIDTGKVTETVDRYGRKAWKYTDDVSKNTSGKSTSVQLGSQMQVTGEQGKRIMAGMQAQKLSKPDGMCSVRNTGKRRAITAPKKEYKDRVFIMSRGGLITITGLSQQIWGALNL